MSEFVKPKHIEINITLHKDLCEGDEICPTCKGLGVVVRDNIYGLDNDPNKTIMFPYKKQSLILCPTCYNGVIRRCNLCGEIIPLQRTKCNCEKQREIDEIEREKREATKLSLAPDATPEILKKSEYFYSDCYGYNEGYFNEWDDFFDYWHELEYDGEAPKVRPEYVWTTEPVDLKLWASDIVSSATEDLYEDAYDSISDKKIDELQKYLDEWCVTSGCGTTYYQGDYKVKIPWEEYDKHIEDYYGRE